MIRTGSKDLGNIPTHSVKIINGNSFDYNMYLKSKIKKENNKSYGLFLEAPTPLFSGDIFIDGEKKPMLEEPQKNGFLLSINFLQKLKI